MKTAPQVLSPIFLFVLISVAAIRPWAACGQQPDNPQPEQETRSGTNTKAHVLNIRFVQTNLGVVGTNVVALADMTNQLARVCGDVDVITVHSSLEPAAGKPELTTQVLGNMARLGIPLLVVEEDGNLSLPARGAEGVPHTLNFSTDLLFKLRAGLGPVPYDARAIPSLRSRMEWNAEKEAYDLRGIELGLPWKKNIWLIYEQDDDGNNIGGIRLKNKW